MKTVYHSVWYRRLLILTLCLSLLVSLTAPALGSHHPRQLDLFLGSTESALVLKQAAIARVEEMPYPNPDLTPPGHDQSKQEILTHLRASIDGTYRGANAIRDDTVFEHDVRALVRLTQLLSLPHPSPEAKTLASEAVRAVVASDRLLAARAIDSLTGFGRPASRRTEATLRLAQQELAKGDNKAARGMAPDAVRDYRKAWNYAAEVIGMILRENDPDSDDLLNEWEVKLGLDPTKADTDGDGIPDGCEVLRLGPIAAHPLLQDTDGNRTSDGDEDPDGDGLTNTEECRLGTDPLSPDTDGDGLSDGEEVQFGTDPLRRDTDADALDDASEHRLGTNPQNPDSNGNGVLDGLETYATSVTTLGGRFSVEVTGVGDIARQVEVRDVSLARPFESMPGRVSPVVDLTSKEHFTSARLRFRINPDLVPHGDFAGLRVLTYDPDSRTMREVEQQGVDTASGDVWAETPHFSIYVVFYVPTWQAAFTAPILPPSNPDEPIPADVLFVLDSSGSMAWNDPRGYRKVAAHRFVDALVPGDRAGVVDFDSRAVLLQGLTEDMVAVKAAINRIDASGGTDIGAGVSIANQEFIARSAPQRIKLQILLTDGVGAYSDTLTRQARDHGIVIYTVGLGYDLDEPLLRRIARDTGGQYFHVAAAEDLPDVISRIPKNPADLDSDGDGLPDIVEQNGIRSCTGVIYNTDPHAWDTDSDGISDGAEVAELMQTSWGDCFKVVSPPDTLDSDGDGIFDAEEQELGLNPYFHDTDSDGLSDLDELILDFDPLDANPDGDRFNDQQELWYGTDPFSYDRSEYENARDFVLGALLGDAGENLVAWGWLDEAKVKNLWYLGGWVASGFVAVGDIRDAIGSLIRLDLVDTFWNLVALAPLIGDAAMVGRVTVKFIGWYADLAGPARKWLARQFADRAPDVHRWVSNHLTGNLYDDLVRRGFTTAELDTLMKAGNKLEDLARAHFRSRTLSQAELDQVDDLVRASWRGLDWSDARKVAEARTTELAVKHLQDAGYEVLYVGRTAGHKGPDLVAVLKEGDNVVDVVIAEAKGTTNGMKVGARLESKVNNRKMFQLSHEWLRTNPSRFMGVIQKQSPKAADLLQEIIDQSRSYRGLVLAGGPQDHVDYGRKMGQFIDSLSLDVTHLEVLKVSW